MSIVGSIVGTIAGMLSSTTYPGGNFTTNTQENFEEIEENFKKVPVPKVLPDHLTAQSKHSVLHTVNVSFVDCAAGMG